MNTIEVHCIVRDYPEDNTNTFHNIKVRHHWNDKEKVVLAIKGKTYTIIANHLIMAIRNAQNAHFA
jgi:hypothetical protein